MFPFDYLTVSLTSGDADKAMFLLSPGHTLQLHVVALCLDTNISFTLSCVSGAERAVTSFDSLVLRQSVKCQSEKSPCGLHHCAECFRSILRHFVTYYSVLRLIFINPHEAPKMLGHVATACLLYSRLHLAKYAVRYDIMLFFLSETCRWTDPLDRRQRRVGAGRFVAVLCSADHVVVPRRFQVHVLTLSEL